MRVLYVAYPMLHGLGIRTQMVEMAKHLGELGVEVDLIPEGGWINLALYDLVHVFTADLRTVFLVTQLHRAGARIVVSPIFAPRHWPWIVRMAAGLSRRVPGIWTNYGSIAIALEQAALVAPNSRLEAAMLRRCFSFAAPVDVIPNGVDPRLTQRPHVNVREHFGIRGPYILYVGEVGSRNKNLLNLIEATKLMDLSLLVVGPDLGTDYARACREAARGGRVVFAGYVGQRDPVLTSAYTESEALVLPSRYETTGLVALEAALMGTRIVITSGGYTREYFGDFAVFVDPPQSVRQIVQAIRVSLNSGKDPSIPTLVSERYGWDVVARLALAAYKRILAEV